MDGIKIITPGNAEADKRKMIEEFVQLTERHGVKTGVFIFFQEGEITQFQSNMPASPFAHIGSLAANGANDVLKMYLGKRHK
jgi:hypothetical protein